MKTMKMKTTKTKQPSVPKLKQPIIDMLKNPLLMGQLAEYKGVHINTIQRWLAENHKKLIQPDTIGFIARRLKIPALELTERRPKIPALPVQA